MKICTILFLSIISITLSAQPAIQWQQCFGGSSSDVAYYVQQTTDSGFVVAGYTESNDSDVTGYHGNRDYWLIKLNSIGALQWQKTYGGTDSDNLNSVQQTSDGGYILCGYSKSNDDDITSNHGQEDYWIVKLNSIGILEWQKSLGGSNVDRAYSIQQISGGGYIVAGSVNSTDGDITFHHGIAVQHDWWILNLDSAGTLIWQKSFGGSGGEYAYSISETADGGFIIAGNSASTDGDVTGQHGTGNTGDYWLVKINSAGIIQWKKSLGGTRDDLAFSVQQTTDGGFIVAGNSYSSDGDVTLHWGSFVDSDYWIVKTDSVGNIQWQKTFGGTDADQLNYISQTSDNGYVAVGYTNSNDGDLTGLHGLSFDYDYWIIKLDVAGSMQWQKVIGGSGNDVGRCIVQTFDDGYIVAGSSSSTNGNVTGNNGSGDFWVVKLGPVTGVNEIADSKINFQVFPNPVSEETVISFEQFTPGKITAVIRDIEGRTIRNLNIETGENQISWNATDDSGNSVKNGVYFLSIQSGKVIETKKIIVLKN